MRQEGARGIQRFTDRHVHVEVTIGAQPADKGHATLGLGTRDVIGQQRLLPHLTDRIVGDVLGRAGAREFAIAHRALVAFPGGEMLVLGDPGIGHVDLAVIHHRTALIVALIAETLEIEGAIAEPAEFIVEPAIERPRIEHVVILPRLVAAEGGAKPQLDRRMVEDPLDHRGIAVFRHALETVEEIIVVIVEAHRQPLQDRGRQLGGLHPPLLDRIALEEGLVEIAADEAQRLFLEGLRIGDRGVGLFLGDEGAGLVGAQGLAEELVDRVQVDRQREHAQLPLRVARGGLHPVLVGLEDLEAVNVVPDLGIVGVEDVRAVDMHHHAGFRVALGMAVAGDVVAGIDDGDPVPGLGQMPPDHRTGQPGPDEKNMHESLRKQDRFTLATVSGAGQWHSAALCPCHHAPVLA
ncbi:hypothetical protein SDC9_21397 [bioreactor metagenome]|uniref:Uncharacterized protein n=1 Tax=bioreactor metagenome TaxID=1076179 RepID=A0A644U9F2_9ZZZZ